MFDATAEKHKKRLWGRESDAEWARMKHEKKMCVCVSVCVRLCVCVLRCVLAAYESK